MLRDWFSFAQDLMPRLDVDAAGVVSVVEEPTLTPHQFPRGASPGLIFLGFKFLSMNVRDDRNAGSALAPAVCFAKRVAS